MNPETVSQQYVFLQFCFLRSFLILIMATDKLEKKLTWTVNESNLRNILGIKSGETYIINERLIINKTISFHFHAYPNGLYYDTKNGAFMFGFTLNDNYGQI